MVSAYREQVAAAVRAAVIHPPVGYSWFSKDSPPFPARLVRSITSRSARTLLLFQLQDQLYKDFYCKGGAGPASDDETPLPAVETMEFVAGLAAACRAVGYSENNGWRVSSVNKDRVLVRRGGLEVWA